MKQRISDSQIDVAIASLFASNPRWADGYPSVRELAQSLKAKFGVRGANQRICNALHRHRHQTPSSSLQAKPPSAVDVQWRERAEGLARELENTRVHLNREIQALQQQLSEALARAEQVEERERAHQDLWADKIFELRQQLKASDFRRPLGVSPDQYLQVHRELKAARDEIAALTASTAAKQK